MIIVSFRKAILVNTLQLKSVQSTLSHMITTSVPRAMFTHFLEEHEEEECLHPLVKLDQAG